MLRVSWFKQIYLESEWGLIYATVWLSLAFLRERDTYWKVSVQMTDMFQRKDLQKYRTWKPLKNKLVKSWKLLTFGRQFWAPFRKKGMYNSTISLGFESQSLLLSPFSSPQILFTCQKSSWTEKISDKVLGLTFYNYKIHYYSHEKVIVYKNKIIWRR
jgi:hypothetical protein